jgi:phospholipase C
MIRRGISRREFLEISLVAGSALVAGCSSSSPSHKAAQPGSSVVRRPKGITAIDHVIIITQENRSFDHYFGTLRGVEGFSQAPKDLLEQDYPANTTAAPVGKLLPFRFDTVSGYGECTNDITHSWGPQHAAWNHGRMDKFGVVHMMQDSAAVGINTMGYYTRQDLPLYYALADLYTICDHYFCSVLGPTHPNRVMEVSGTLYAGEGKGGPVLVTAASSSYEGTLSWETMPERLSRAGISWHYYEVRKPEALFKPGTSLSGIVSDNPLLYFRQFLQEGTELYANAFTHSYPDDLLADIANDNLPSVAWVNLPDPAQEHPPAPPLAGMIELKRVLEALFANPKVYAKTAVFVTYDENGGFFDHVAPPVSEPGTPGEWLPSASFPGADGIAGPIGLGFRVPMLVISPYSRGGYVCTKTLDHTSTLLFLEARFGVEAPNISEWRRKTVGDLTEAFDFSRPDFSIPALPDLPEAVPPNDQAGGCSIGVVLGNFPNQRIPNPQSFPAQEPGTRPRRP